jgi:methionyl-tRNA formyltransferase
MPPPIKQAAIEWGLPVHQPASADELAAAVAGLAADVAVVVAYGRILRPEVLALPGNGFINVHFSLLPRWRGAAPVERAILAGDEKTGVTLMVIDVGLDTGPVLARRSLPIGPDATGGSVTAALAGLGAVLLGEVLPAYLAGEIPARSQNDRAATLAPKIRPEEARLTARQSAERLVRAVRAFRPRPSAWLEVEGKRLGITAAQVAPGEDVSVGTLERRGHRLLLGVEDGAVEVLSVHPEGGRPVSGASWADGRRGRPAQTE